MLKRSGSFAQSQRHFEDRLVRWRFAFSTIAWQSVCRRSLEDRKQVAVPATACRKLVRPAFVICQFRRVAFFLRDLSIEQLNVQLGAYRFVQLLLQILRVQRFQLDSVGEPVLLDVIGVCSIFLRRFRSPTVRCFSR